MKKRGTRTGSYHRKRKAERADRYGRFANGKRVTADVIAGRKIYDGASGE